MQKDDYMQRSRFDAYFKIVEWFKGLNCLIVHANSFLEGLTRFVSLESL